MARRSKLTTLEESKNIKNNLNPDSTLVISSSPSPKRRITRKNTKGDDKKITKKDDKTPESKSETKSTKTKKKQSKKESKPPVDDEEDEGKSSKKITSKTPKLKVEESPIPLIPPSPKKSPLKSKKLNSSPEDGGDTSNIIMELYDYGYNPLNTIIIKDDDKEFCKYVKCRNQFGKIIYIELDDKGHIVTDKNSLVYYPDENLSIPHSLKTGSLSEIGNSVSAVCWECSEGICILNLGTNGEQMEVKFGTKEKISKSNPTPYPVIKMTELVQYPDMVNDAADLAHDKLRDNDIEKTTEDLEKIYDSMSLLYNSFEDFDNVRKQILNEYISEIMMLNEEATGEDIENMTEKELNKYKKIRHEMSLRQDRIIEMLNLSKTIISLKNDIDSVTQKINQVVDTTYNIFG